MGSLQKAVKSFLAVLDNTMLDRWIPDEDWVRQIRESDENDCPFRNAQREYQTQLTSMEENLKAQQAKERVSEMLSKLDNNKTNVAMDKRGREDIPPQLLGYFPYNHLGKRVNVNELKKELDCRGVENWTIKDGPTKGLKILKTIEKKRFEETVEKALTDRGKTFVGLSITEKLTRLDGIMKTNEESKNGEFNVDFGKFFKNKRQTLM
jgi:hypothetical protein